MRSALRTERKRQRLTATESERMSSILERPHTELGTEVLNPVASTALTVPTGAQYAVICPRSAGIHVSFDGTAATTSDQYFPADAPFTVIDATDLANVRLIDSTDGASTTYVTYFTVRA